MDICLVTIIIVFVAAFYLVGLAFSGLKEERRTPAKLKSVHKASGINLILFFLGVYLMVIAVFLMILSYLGVLLISSGEEGWEGWFLTNLLTVLLTVIGGVITLWSYPQEWKTSADRGRTALAVFSGVVIIVELCLIALIVFFMAVASLAPD